MKKISVVPFIVILFGSIMMLPALVSADEAVRAKTLENLQTAYNGESNANAKYLAYAQKADQEGYHKVARLFRAAAGAEEVHLINHARVIESMGAVPEAKIEIPEVKSTKENLQDAIKGETYEANKMYPEFISQAEKANNGDAVQTFTYARDAEAAHAQLYQKALNNLDKWKKADKNFYVCPTCGYLTEGKPAFESCPICGTAKNNFLVIS
jgi:rubrerythrin